MGKSNIRKKIIFVLGSSNSGADIITECLSGLKLDVGKSYTKLTHEDGSEYWVNQKIENLNQDILKDFDLLKENRALDNWNEDLVSQVEKYKPYLDEIIKTDFGRKRHILIYAKELVYTLSFWNKLIDEKKFDTSFVIVYQDPNKLIHTNQALTKFSKLPVRDALRWINAYLSTEKYSSDGDRYFIDFEHFYQHRFDAVYDLSKELKLGLSSNNKSFSNHIEKVLEESVVSIKSSSSGLRSELLKNYSAKIYTCLKEFQTNNSDQAANKIKEIRQEYDALSKDFITGTSDAYKSQLSIATWNNQNVVKWQKNTLYKGPNEINLSIEDKDSIHKLCIYPSNRSCYVKIDKLSINGSDEIPVQKRNTLLEHGNLYIINAETEFSLEFSESVKQVSINLIFDCISFGNSAFNHLSELQSKINSWILKRHDEYESQIILLEEESLSYESTIKELSAHLKKHESLMEKWREYKLRWDHVIESIPKNKQEVNPLEAMIASNTKKEKVINKLKNKINELRRTLQGTEHELIEYKNAKPLNKNKIELAETHMKLKFKEEKILELKNKLSENTSLINKLNKKLKTKSRKIDKLKESILSGKFENDKLSYQVKLNFEKIDELNEKVSFLSEQNESLIKESYHFLEEAKEKTFLLEEKTETIEQLQHEFIEESNKKNYTIQKKEQELERFNSQLQELKLKLEQAEEEKKQLLESKEVSEEVKILVKQKEETIKELYNDIDELSEDSKNLSEELNNREREINELKESISFKLGKGLTSPLRWAYDKSTGNKPINQSRLWLLQQMFKSGVKNPAKAVKSLSPKNIKTLSGALRNEPPHIIAENLNRLLDNNEVETIDNIPEPNENRQKVLFISPNLPDFDTSSGGRRATRMLELMAEEFEVYAFTLGSQPEKYINKLNDLGIVVLRTRNYHRIKKKIPQFNAIIYAWYYTYFDANKFTELYPSAKVILDSVDVHWIREERSLGIWDNITEEDVRKNKKREIEAYRNADVIWAVTETDKENIHIELPKADVRVVSNIHDIHKESYIDSGTNNMLFFGGFNHYPNISAVKMIVKDILPNVRSKVPDAKLIIAGANAPDDVKVLGQIDGVDFKGFIEEEELDNLYENSFAAVAPLLAGAGIKGKICEAIAYSIPVFTNSVGNEGIHLETGKDGFVSDNMDELSTHLIRAMQREYDMASITDNAQRKLRLLVGPEGVKQNLIGSIMPEVSICIVTWNRMDLLKRCIESIEGNTDYPYYKILVHSNGCEDGTQDYLKAAAEINPRIIPILSPDNEVFVKPNNAMMQMFPNNDAVLVNNDVYVTKGWLKALVNTAYSDTNIGIAGSKILYPDETLQEFGSELYEDGTGRNIGKWDDPNKDDYKILKRVGYVSGCSMYIKRSTINQIGVFDEQFHPCYCEDSDLCYTAWENGIETVVTPQSVIYHDEGGTSGTDEDSGFKAYQKVNFEKFLKKHKKNLSDIQKRIESLN